MNKNARIRHQLASWMDACRATFALSGVVRLSLWGCKREMKSKK